MLLGHNDLEQTTIYLHVSERRNVSIRDVNGQLQVVRDVPRTRRSHRKSLRPSPRGGVRASSVSVQVGHEGAMDRTRQRKERRIPPRG
jgi:hypothetical protein